MAPAVLVEGDRAALEALAETRGRDAEQGRVAVLSLHGAQSMEVLAHPRPLGDLDADFARSDPVVRECFDRIVDELGPFEILAGRTPHRASRAHRRPTRSAVSGISAARNDSVPAPCPGVA